MSDEKNSILLSDVTIDGNLIEKDKIVLDAKINGDVKANEIDAFENSNIIGNISSKKAFLGGKLQGNVNSETIKIKKTADTDRGKYSKFLVLTFFKYLRERNSKIVIEQNSPICSALGKYPLQFDMISFGKSLVHDLFWPKYICDAAFKGCTPVFK